MSMLIDMHHELIDDDIIFIDVSKIEILNKKIDFVFLLFNACIEYDFSQDGKQENNFNQKKNQLIRIFGEEKNRKLAKNYINSLCNPEFTQIISLNKNLENKFETEEKYINNLILSHQVHISLFRDRDKNAFGKKLSIQGSPNQVHKVKNIIELEMQKYSSKDNENNRNSDDDGDIICLSDCPKIQMNNNKDNQNQKTNLTNILSNNNEQNVRKNIENSLDRLEFDTKNINFNQIDINSYSNSLDNLKTGNQHKSKWIIDNNEQTINDKLHEKNDNFFSNGCNIDKFGIIDEDKNDYMENMSKSESIIILNDSDEKISNKEFSNIKNSKKKQHVDEYLRKNNISCFNSNQNSNINFSLSDLTKYNTTMDLSENFENDKKIKIPDSSEHTNNIYSKDFNDNMNFGRNKNKILNGKITKINEPISFSNINPQKDQDSSNDLNSVNLNKTSLSNASHNLKYIVIDGSNVAREHGKEFGKIFSCKGIKIVVDFFLKRGHTEIKALVPRFRRGNSDTECPTRNPEILDDLEHKGFLSYTPSRYVNNKLILPYDDRFILKAALHYNAIVISNDNYRDLMQENIEWKRLIETSLLQYTFIGDLFLIADDPLGRRGPNLDQFLSTKNYNNHHIIKHKNKNKQKQSNQSYMSSMNNNNKNKNSNNELIEKSKQHKNKFKERTPLQTINLKNQLLQIFPISEQLIDNLLNNNSNEFRLEFFTEKILEGL